MIPGTVTKLSEASVASAASIVVTTDLIRLTGSTAIANISVINAGFSGILFIVPVDGSVLTTTTGNIPVAVTMAINRVTVLVYSKATGKWYPGAIS